MKWRTHQRHDTTSNDFVILFGYVPSINLVTVGQESIHVYEGNPTNLHYPFFFQCLGRTQWICFFDESAYLDHPIGCLRNTEFQEKPTAER